MKAKKGLQKLTKPAIMEKYNQLYSLEQITFDHLKVLEDNEHQGFMDYLSEKSKDLKGKAYDKFWHKVEPITQEETKNQLWEYNHIQITYAIATLIQELGRMPSKAELAKKTELSRQTIHKHLKEYTTHPLYQGELEQFRFMYSKLLSKVLTFAIQGDVAAAKLYFQVMGSDGHIPKQINNNFHNQNNYIQINNTILNQEKLSHLTLEQLADIEKIILSIGCK